MKKIFVLLLPALLMLVSHHAQAQFAVEGSGFGIYEAVNPGGGAYLNRAIGASMGASYFARLTPDFFLRAGMDYQFTYDPDAKGFEHGLEIPLTANLSLGYSQEYRPYLFAGPTLQLGIGGKTGGSPSVPRFDKGVQNRFNVLAGGGVGLELVQNEIFFQLGYQYGLMNYRAKNNTPRHRHYIRLGVAFMI